MHEPTPDPIPEVIDALNPLLGQGTRWGRLLYAFPDKPGERVVNRIDFSGANDVFVPALVRELILAGEVEGKGPALIVLLESLYGSVGVDGQARFHELIARLRPILSAPNAAESIARFGERQRGAGVGQALDPGSVWKRMLERVLADASRSFGRPLDWPALDALFVRPTLATGLLPRLREWGFEDVERRRAAGERAPEGEINARLKVQSDPTDGLPEPGRQHVSWETIRQRIKRTIVLGDPGFGKSVALWHETARRCVEALDARQTAANEKAVFLRAADWARHAVPPGPAPAVLAGLLQALTAEYDLSAEDRAWLEADLRTGRCVVIADGLDEVPQEL
jgi:hypothetical protein